MDIVRIQSLIAQGRVIDLDSISGDDIYFQVGVWQPGNRRIGSGKLNSYAPAVLSYKEMYRIFTGCKEEGLFKEGSVGPKVSFRRSKHSGGIDVIIPGKLELTRSDNGGGLFNIAVESSYNNSSPRDTSWNTQYVDAANTSWASLWDISNRSYETWYNAIQTPEGSNAPPQYVGMKVIMKYLDPTTFEERFWLIEFTEWGVGQYDEQGVFAYDRYEIYPAVEFQKVDYVDTDIDKISKEVHIGRKSNGGGIYNVLDEPFFEIGVSPRKTKWNSIYTDSRTGYSGYSDLSNLENRVYTDFGLALNYNIGNNVLDTDLIMHDLTTDLYYKVNFKTWTSGGNGGGFEYVRQVIPQSCPVKFGDGTVMTTAAVPVAAEPSFNYEIGQDVPSEGGVIAHRWWSTTPGGVPEKGTVQNYLVIDYNELTSGVYSNINLGIGSAAQSLWDGLSNTNAIIAQGATSGAAYECDNSGNQGKNDWYLPSVQEFLKIWYNYFEISQGLLTAGGTQLDMAKTYWSSTELVTGVTTAWAFRLTTDGLQPIGKTSTALNVRAIRKFSI